MRLLLWALVVALVTFLSSSEAASNLDQEQVVQSDSNYESLGRVLAAESVVSNGKRVLRSESESTVSTIDEEDDEERAISVSGTAQAISKVFNRRFTEYMNEGKTPAAVRRDLDNSGAYMSWPLLSRNKKYANRYKAWLEKYHPDSPLLHADA
ncbi:unnamed protein product [Phytophthora lilii]|uniref:RxLR effector protein n=1 Tax=Phytophthora lilii TaxID=2077276 RepID=A0A9W7CJ14_9STRA|nr:unnamed protein product [Phytophthora lilii]